MPLESRDSLIAGELMLPPPFTLVKLREVGDAFAHATSIAAKEGAGTLVYIGRFDLAEFAVVLEPETPLRRPGAAFMPAWRRWSMRWPPTRSRKPPSPSIGRIRSGSMWGWWAAAAWAGRKERKEDEMPPWLVFGAMIRTASLASAEPGVNPHATALEEEGFTDLLAGQLVESFARHFMVYVDSWQEQRLRHGGAQLSGAAAARDAASARSIDDNGDLLTRGTGKTEVERQAFLPRLAKPAWLDPNDQGAARMKLLRTIQLDQSDTFVFEKAAEPGEWAVPGAFVFWDRDPTKLEGKARTAFRSGFLGVSSLGWSTLVQIVEASDADRAIVVESLAQRLVESFGAPDMDAARAAAEEEVAFAASLCSEPKDTLIAMHRTYEDGEVHEEFRTLKPRNGPKPARAFSFLEVEGEDEERARRLASISLR